MINANRVNYSSSSGELSFIYDRIGDKFKLKEIKFNQITIVARANIWINNLPAKYLKGFKSCRLPETEFTLIIKGMDYYLTLKKVWECWPTPVQNFYLTVKDKDIQFVENRTDFEVVSCLKVLGLKQYLKEQCIKDSYSTPYQKLEIILEDQTLFDMQTLEECCITLGTRALIETAPQADLPQSFEQMSTGSEYVSTLQFKNCVNELIKKIGIVCVLINGDGVKAGSGFLIGPNLIMTNAHIAPSKERCKGMKAIFYHEVGARWEVEVSFDEFIHASPSPGFNYIHGKNLDFSIIKVKFTKWYALFSFIKIINLWHLAKKGDNFFNHPQILNRNSKNIRANIIQHPDGTELKQISFRENRVKDATQYTFHYETQTNTGTSGSPVINDQGEFIGLHASSCRALDIILFKHRKLLFDDLGLGSYSSDLEKHYNFANFQTLEIYFSEDKKNQCRDITKEDEWFTLYKLIQLKNVAVKNEMAARNFAYELLKLHHVEELKYCHVICNTGIVASKILQIINGNQDLKKKILNAKKWSRDDIKPFVIPIATILISGLGLYLWTKKGKRP